jgi:Uma2 family endonuclease
MSTTRTITDEDLLNLPKDGNKYEVVDGELRMSPAGWVHEIVVINVATRLNTFVREHRLGHVLGSNTLYVLPSGNKRGPDVSFIRSGRLPRGKPAPFLELVPDLAIEVLSPGDSPRAVLDKVGEYLQAGVQLVIVIDPQRRKAAVHRSLSDVREINADGELDGEDVVPGFRCPLTDILPAEED